MGGTKRSTESRHKEVHKKLHKKVQNSMFFFATRLFEDCRGHFCLDSVH